MIKGMFANLVQKTLILLLIGVILLTPTTSFAKTSSAYSDQNRVQLLEQIQKLLTEVLRLQTILKDRAVSSSNTFSNYTPYETYFFKQPTEKIYLVDSGELVSLKKNESVRVVDKQLFDLFTSVIGKDEVANNIKEWRVFKDESSDLGAFVELIAGTEDWIVGVNRDGYEENNKQVTESFINLYIHEYGHILLFSKPDFEQNFKEEFWTASDIRHESKVKQSSASTRFSIMSDYYANNLNRFVSDYATMNPDEDMAETFLSFILEDKPLGINLKERKILAFFEEVDFVKLRTKLRYNLTKLGVI
jgi:hypothetical protein